MNQPDFTATQLNWLFFDLDSYFASVEQQLNPELQNKPIIVIPSISDKMSAIAVSYEARKFGIKTGTKVFEAKRLCPKIICVAARPEIYVHYHHLIFNEINKHICIDHVFSVDEGACLLTGQMMQKKNIIELSKKVKAALNRNIGSHISCSIGVGSNKFIAKIASNINKPNGLTIIDPDAIESTLSTLQLKNLPGIGNATKARLANNNINSVADLYKLNAHRLQSAWGSIVGKRYWYLLRGVDLPLAETKKSTISQSRVLIQEERQLSEARKVAMALILKAAFRAREKQLLASTIICQIDLVNTQIHKQSFKINTTNDSTTLSQCIMRYWDKTFSSIKNMQLKKISITLTNLEPDSGQLCLMDLNNQKKRQYISKAIDDLNRKFGTNMVSLGLVNLKKQEHSAIAFDNIPKQ